MAETSPTDAAEAAAATVIAKQQADSKQRYEDSLDITDPGQPEKAKADSPSLPAPKGVESPRLSPGASADGGFTEDLLDRAHALGITEDEARQYPAALLEKTVRRLEDSYTFETDAVPQFPPAQPAQQPQPFTLPGLDPEKFAPEIIDALQARDQFYQGVLARQQQELEQARAVHSQVQQRDAQDRINRLDQLFTKDEDYQDVLGKGSLQDIQGTRHHTARHQIAVRMDSIEREYTSLGQRAPAVDQIYEQARNSLYGHRAAQRAQSQVEERLRNRSGQFIARPTSTSRDGGGSPEERAVVAADRFMRAAGMR